MTSYNDLVPGDYQAELMSLGAASSMVAFRIGDITLEIIDLLRGEQSGAKLIYEVYPAVGMFAGKAARTIREYAAVAGRFPVEIRERYDMLSFDHFRQAAMMGDVGISALDWCMDQIAVMGRPATVDAMARVWTFTSQPDSSITEDRGQDNGGRWGVVRAAVSTLRGIIQDVKRDDEELYDLLLIDVEDIESRLQEYYAVDNGAEMRIMELRG